MTETSRRQLLLGVGLAGAAVGLSVETAAADGMTDGPIQLNEPALPEIPAPVAESDEQLVEAQSDAPSLERSDDAEQVWEKLKGVLTNEYSPTEDTSIVTSLRTIFTRIESGFRFMPEKADDDFSFLHIEPLIDQAADLFDRGLRDRASYEEIAKDFFERILELGEYADLDAIHREEEKAGVYEVQAKMSSAEWRAEKNRYTGSNTISENLYHYLRTQLNPGKLNEQSAAAQLAGVLSHVVPYMWHGQSFLGYQAHTWNGVSKLAYEHAKDAAFISSWGQLRNTEISVNVQAGEAAYASAASKRLAEGLADRSAWETKNISFQRQRTLTARKFQDLKAKAALEADGVLNQGKRLPAIRRRFHQDVRNALARVQAIEPGLRSVYGYKDELPKDETRLEFFDDCLSWSRRVIDWIIRFSRQDQSVVLPVSLRGILGARAWREGRRAGRWTFKVGDPIVPGMAHVRLRGLSAFVVDDGGNQRFWGLRVRPPVLAECVHLDGSRVTLDQSKVPPIWFGRVATRVAVREPDVLGTAALHNASPLGDWAVEVFSRFPTNLSLDTISDLHLDLHLAFRAAT